MSTRVLCGVFVLSDSIVTRYCQELKSKLVFTRSVMGHGRQQYAWFSTEIFVSPAKNCAQCTEQITPHLGTKRLQNKVVSTLEFHESINHQVASSCFVSKCCVRGSLCALHSCIVWSLTHASLLSFFFFFFCINSDWPSVHYFHVCGVRKKCFKEKIRGNRISTGQGRSGS